MDWLISVIVPVYNSEKTIENTVGSIQKQDYHNIEIILVNDGSTDNTKEICSSLEKRDSRISLYSIKNGGPSVARQYGLDRANGRLITFCDADDMMKPTMLSTLYQMMRSQRSQLTACSFKYADDDEECDYKIEIWNQENAIKHCLIDTFMGGFLWNKMFDLKIIKEHNIRFDESVFYCEDMEFVIEYLMYCKKIAYIKKPLYCYIYQDNSLSSGELSWKKITNIIAREKILNMLKSTNLKKVISLAERELVLQSVYGGRAIEKANSNEKKNLTNEQFEIITKAINRNCSQYGWHTILHNKCSVKDKINIIRFGFWKKWKREN